VSAGAQSRFAEPAAPALRFGVLPMGGTFESRRSWQPVLDELGHAVGRPVASVSVPSYESLERAIARNQVDLAFLSGKLALDAVLERRMRVVAEVDRVEGRPAAHRAVLLARKAPPFNSLGALLAAPQRWRIARGDSRSVSGYIVPQAQLFLPNGIEIETRFLGEVIGTHQETALAVANGDADVATNNTTDLERFRQQFPVEAARLQVIWQSEPTPPAQIVVRADWPRELQQRVRAFLVAYGREPGPRGEAQRGVLRSLHADRGWRAADNSALLPVARLEHQLARQRALAGQWVSEEARRTRLARLEAEHARQIRWLEHSETLSKT
jgi:phosphonate transport system substrate-binding protein